MKKQRHYFAYNGPYRQSSGLSSSQVWMWELDNKKGWALKNWCPWTVVLENTSESLLDSKVIKPVNPKGNWPWIFIGRTDAEAEVPLLWPPDSKSWLTGKYLMLRTTEGRRKRGQQRMRCLDGITDSMDMSSEQTPEDGEGQGSLMCYSPWGRKESTWLVTEQQLSAH